MQRQGLAWGATALIAALSIYIGAATFFMELGAVMHDLHCTDHQAKP